MNKVKLFVFAALISINLQVSAGINDLWKKTFSEETRQEITQSARALGLGFITPLLINEFANSTYSTYNGYTKDYSYYRSYTDNQLDYLRAGLGLTNLFNVSYPSDKGKFKRLLLTAIGFCAGGAVFHR